MTMQNGISHNYGSGVNAQNNFAFLCQWWGNLAAVSAFHKSIKLFINWLLGPLLFCWLVWDLYQQVGGQSQVLEQWRRMLPVFSESALQLGFGLVFLMFVQWGMEVMKWQMMLRPHLKLNLHNGFSAIFSGIAISMITPNRMGEFAGRVMHLPPNLRILGTAYTFIGNFGQMLVTWCFGWMAIALDHKVLHRLLQSEGILWLLPWIHLPMALIVMLMATVYFGSGKMIQRIIQLKWLAPFKANLNALGEMSISTLGRVFILSGLRFLVFLLQYWIVFHYLVGSVPAYEMFIGISFMFIWLSVIPTVSLFELGLRWQFAVLLFGGISGNAVAISAAVTLVWLTNLILPAAIGAMMILFWKPFSSND